MFTAISLTGRVTADLEPQNSQNGTPYVQFYVAVNKGYGEHQHPNFYQCVLFGKAVERAVNAGVQKGSLLFIAGDLDLVEYTGNQTGTKEPYPRSRYMNGITFPPARKRMMPAQEIRNPPTLRRGLYPYLQRIAGKTACRTTKHRHCGQKRDYSQEEIRL